MKLEQFELSVPEAEESSNGYAALAHGSVYSIQLRNSSARRCDVAVKIDGHQVGLWRVNSFSSIRLERPATDNGRFTFLELGTPQAEAAGLEKNESLGLVSAEFIPEKAPDRSSGQTLLNPGTPSPFAGGTGLSGRSNQQFHSVESLIYDRSKAVTLHLRLASKPPSIRPLTGRQTPVPPPLH